MANYCTEDEFILEEQGDSFGFASTIDGPLPIEMGGTGQNSSSRIRTNLSYNDGAYNSPFGGAQQIHVTGILPIANGGTGATTAEGARTNLGIDPLFPTRTASGAEIAFTDGANGAAVVELTVTITPTQSGEGEPTPTNIRPISGIDSLTLSHWHTDSSLAETISYSFEDTVYQGVLNVVTGKLTITHAMLTFNTSAMNNSENYPGWNGSGIRAIIGAGHNGQIECLCNVGLYVNANTTGDTKDLLFLPKGKYNKTQSDWQALALNVQVLAAYATPVVIDLTPEDVRTFLGENHFTVSSGTMQMEYRADLETVVTDRITACEMALMDDTGFFYTTASAVHSWTSNSGGAISFTVGGRLTPRLREVANTPLEWADITNFDFAPDLYDTNPETGLPDPNLPRFEINYLDNTICTFNIASYNALVYNPVDGHLHFRAKSAHTDANYNKRDIVLVANTWYNPLFGEIVTEMNVRRIGALETTFSELPLQTFNASYHAGATDFASKCQSFASLINGTVEGTEAISDYEAFLWFTDPHLLEDRKNATNDNPGWTWQARCSEFISQIQKYANSTPISFTLCGGDWIGNKDYPNEAAFKLGYVNGFMRSMFKNAYTLVGNHDTNDQGVAAGLDRTDANKGTTRLTNQAIDNLLFAGSRSYYKLDGRNSVLYCLDTGDQGQTLAAFGNYGYDQLKWLADGLSSETAAHIILAAHILYVSTSTPNTYQPLTLEALKICQTFNARSTYSLTYGGNTYTFNFSDRTGKVEFGLMGHTHEDAYRLMQPDAQKDPILCVVTDNVRQDVSLGPTFDLVCADYDNRRLHMIRVGYGSDRTFNMDTGALV